MEGFVIDGYIRNATGELIDFSSNIVIETFTTNNYGQYNLSTPISRLPNFYKIKILPGGIDISTGKTVTSTLSNVSTKETALQNQNGFLCITPLSTIITSILDYKITTGETLSISTLDSSTSTLTTMFDISLSDINSDFISDKNIELTKITQQIEITTNVLSSTITEISSTDNVFNMIGQTITDMSSTTNTFSFNNSISNIIDKIEEVENISLNTSLKTNVSDLVEEINTIVSNLSEIDTFETIIVKSVQLSEATIELVNDTDDEIDFTSTTLSISNLVDSIQNNADNIVVYGFEPEPEPEPEPEDDSNYITSVTLYEGWNIVSVPTTSDYNATLLSNATSQTIYKFDSSIDVNAYRSTTTPILSEGYWIKSSTRQIVSFQGDSPSEVILNLNKGWNLIGSLNEPSVLVDNDNILNVHTSLYGYIAIDKNYNVKLKTNIVPGYGYWCLANTSGTLIMRKK